MDNRSNGYRSNRSDHHNDHNNDHTKMLLSPDDQKHHFDPMAYLNQYYGDNSMTKGLKIILFFLPNIAARLKFPVNQGHKVTLLDIGSGPAIYMALGLREKVDRIILSDYAEQNRRELKKWCQGKPSFDWAPIVKAICKLEGDTVPWATVENQARDKVVDVIHCNVHEKKVLGSTTTTNTTPHLNETTFDLVSSIFCVEYASRDFVEYKNALINVCSLIKPGGTLILGGAYEECFYTIGQKKFACHYLTEDQLFEALRLADIDVDDENPGSFAYYLHENAFVIVARKKF